MPHIRLAGSHASESTSSDVATVAEAFAWISNKIVDIRTGGYRGAIGFVLYDPDVTIYADGRYDGDDVEEKFIVEVTASREHDREFVVELIQRFAPRVRRLIFNIRWGDAFDDDARIADFFRDPRFDSIRVDSSRGWRPSASFVRAAAIAPTDGLVRIGPFDEFADFDYWAGIMRILRTEIDQIVVHGLNYADRSITIDRREGRRVLRVGAGVYNAPLGALLFTNRWHESLRDSEWLRLSVVEFRARIRPTYVDRVVVRTVWGGSRVGFVREEVVKTVITNFAFGNAPSVHTLVLTDDFVFDRTLPGVSMEIASSVRRIVVDADARGHRRELERAHHVAYSLVPHVPGATMILGRPGAPGVLGERRESVRDPRLALTALLNPSPLTSTRGLRRISYGDFPNVMILVREMLVGRDDEDTIRRERAERGWSLDRFYG
jgi:hypothetical protein